MKEQILVPIKRHDRIDDVVPYLKEVAKPGMRVVFLIPYPATGSGELFHDYMVTTESRAEVAKTGETIIRKYSWEEQRRLAEQKVAPAREALHKRGVEVAVDLYMQSLKRVVESYTRNGDVHLVMEQAGIGLRVLRFLQETVGLFSLLKRPGFSPVLLLYPNHRV